MGSAEEILSTPPDPDELPRRRGRVVRALSGSRDLARIAYRDPEHLSERLPLYAMGRLGQSSQDWGQSARDARPEASRARIAEELRLKTARIARIDGAISGTPFFIALVPGYLTYLL